MFAYSMFVENIVTISVYVKSLPDVCICLMSNMCGGAEELSMVRQAVLSIRSQKMECSRQVHADIHTYRHA